MDGRLQQFAEDRAAYCRRPIGMSLSRIMEKSTRVGMCMAAMLVILLSLSKSTRYRYHILLPQLPQPENLQNARGAARHGLS